MMTGKVIGYWVTTTILAFALFAGGVAYLMHLPVINAGMTHLGYPLYLPTILGGWKVLGAIVLLLPRLPRLKEWVYAGAFFNMTGAVASHILSGDTLIQFLWPLFFAVCTIFSWALRPESRTVGVLFRSKPMCGPIPSGEDDTTMEGGTGGAPVAGRTV